MASEQLYHQYIIKSNQLIVNKYNSLLYNIIAFLHYNEFVNDFQCNELLLIQGCKGIR